MGSLQPENRMRTFILVALVSVGFAAPGNNKKKSLAPSTRVWHPASSEAQCGKSENLREGSPSVLCKEAGQKHCGCLSRDKENWKLLCGTCEFKLALSSEGDDAVARKANPKRKNNQRKNNKRKQNKRQQNAAKRRRLRTRMKAKNNQNKQQKQNPKRQNVARKNAQKKKEPRLEDPQVESVDPAAVLELVPEE